MTAASPAPRPSLPQGRRAQEVLAIEGLSLSYRTPRGRMRVLRDVSLSIAAGEAVGLVGESGSGKSTLAYAVMRHLAGNARIDGGRIVFEGEDLLQASAARMTALRGTRMAMVYQDPATALNPTLRLGEQVAEILVHHRGLARSQAWAEGEALLRRVSLPDPAFMMGKFPHEVSGGEKQRVLIAMAFACQPALLVFDEPTTALDATTAAGIIDLIGRLQEESGVAVLYITHDLGIVRTVASRIAVIYGGAIVEEGAAAAVLGAPLHPYARALLASVPRPGATGRRLVAFGGLPPDLHAPPPGCIFQARCPFVVEACRAGAIALGGAADHPAACIRLPEIAALPLPAPRGAQEGARHGGDGVVLAVDDLRVDYGRRRLSDRMLGRPSPMVRAVQGVSLDIRAGETLGLVGESGCGKSTLARALVGLVPARGAVRLDGAAVDWSDAQDARRYRRAVQIVFQHPDLSLNPRMTIGEIVARPIRIGGGQDAAARVAHWLDRVRLPASFARRHPHELSGGEKQRVAIARAFAAQPRLVICDEITSGLDVSVQAAIVNLLGELQDELGTAYLFVAHDLNLVRHFADRVAVMYLGRIVELRASADVFRPPYHPYTEALLSAAPVPDPALVARRVRLEGPLPSPTRPPPGCAFHTRCPHRIGAVCDKEPPPLRTLSAGHWLTCHLPAAALAAMPGVWQQVEREASPAPSAERLPPN